MQLRLGRWFRGFMGLVRHGGLIGIHGSARVSVQGVFAFGQRVSIGRNSIIQVPKNSTLRLGDRVHIGREVEVSPATEISIGNHTSVQDRCNFLGQVAVGAHCIFAPNVFISSRIHQFMERPAWLIRDQDALLADPTYVAANPRCLPVHIDEDCWVGINAVIMRGVTLGRGCVVGANSVVTKSFPPYSVIAGAPARLFRSRLAFHPPRSISSAVPEHLPYFYSGFDLRQRAVAASSTGMKACGRFRLALDCSAARSIVLDVHADQPLKLACLRQERVLPVGAQQVSFELAALPPDGLIAMEATDRQGRPCRVAIRSAGVRD
jgi:acetyltransferase-like isoleucine patch superfamily enzyme